MLLLLLILLPFVTGLLSFLFRSAAVKGWTLFSTLITLVLGILLCCPEYNVPFQRQWIPSLGAQFSLSASNMSVVLVLLNALVFPLIFISQWKKPLTDDPRFYGLMLLSQAGLMGVFLAHDLLLFYFFWELALVPVYFLCSMWGGPQRIPVTFKFFVYTFLGSLLMLAGLIFLYLQNPTRSFDWDLIQQTGAALPASVQQLLFLAFFLAFGIKMPIFPLHTWQPATYEQSAT